MSVLQDLRDAFREAVQNFKAELNRDRIPRTVDELVLEMREEVIDSQAYLRGLEEDIRRTLKRAEEEEERAATCRRRERLAREIDDEETARVAQEFADKHDQRQQVLERKALALKDELDLRRADVRAMLERLDEARSKRESLGAEAGRARARDSIQDADDLFAELERMAEKIGDFERRTRASEELEEALADMESHATTTGDPEGSTEDRLRELKRRMNEGSGP